MKSDQEFVTKLNKVMNLSYMNSGVFRGGRKNREKNHENNVLSVVRRKFNSRTEIKTGFLGMEILLGVTTDH